MMQRNIHGFLGVTGCLAALSGVAMGAFGAHALKESLSAGGMVEVWKTAASYQIWHALALVLCAQSRFSSRLHSTAAALFTVGIILFSGSLYWLALEGPRWLGPITPLGGLSLIVAWGLLAVSFWRNR